MSLNFLLALALLAVIVVVLVRRSALASSERAWRPPALQAAVLRYSERTFRTTAPFRLAARVDRAYDHDAGLTLVEYKTRPRDEVYLSDVIELSAQRLAVEGETGRAVHDTAYVLVDCGSGHRSVHSVQLLPPDRMVLLKQRRDAIVTGRASPNRTRAKGLCRTCGHAARCER